MISIISNPQVLKYLLLFLLWALVHSILASLTVKDFLHRRLRRSYHFFRIIYVVISIVSLLALFLVAPLPQDLVYSFEGLIFYFLKAVQTLALIAFLFTATTSIEDDFLGLRELGKFFSAKLDNDLKPLRTEGIMKYSRHPLYLFAMVLLWSDPQMTIGWLTMTVAFSIYFIIGSIFEERKLVSLYGDDYRAYQEKVRRFIPLKKVPRGTRSERSL